MTPELDQLQARLSALMTYRVAADVLAHLLPIDAGKIPETLRSHTLRVSEQLSDAASDQPAAAKKANATWRSASATSRPPAEDDRCSER